MTCVNLVSMLTNTNLYLYLYLFFFSLFVNLSFVKHKSNFLKHLRSDLNNYTHRVREEGKCTLENPRQGISRVILMPRSLIKINNYQVAANYRQTANYWRLTSVVLLRKVLSKIGMKTTMAWLKAEPDRKL